MQRVVVLEHRAAFAGEIADGVVDVAVGAGTVLLALVRTERAAGGFEPVESVVGKRPACGKEVEESERLASKEDVRFAR